MFISSVEALHTRLREYIEAVYHISSLSILEQRRRLLDEIGVLRQPPFIESTKVYAKGAPFRELLQGAPREIRDAVDSFVRGGLLFDPPYDHQGQSIRALLEEQRDIVVFTGTGSGKTECFTTPILLRLLSEAFSARESFSHRAVRALVLYPMNALVNDQLSRVRRLFGNSLVSEAFRRFSGRPVTFGQYTGRTPFAGVRSFDEGDGKKMETFRSFYIDTVLRPMQGSDEKKHADSLRLYNGLTARGRWPAKEDLLRWFGGPGTGTLQWKDRLHPHPVDSELVARHEFYGYVTPDGQRFGAPPDLLITNYSMLEYMLMRPIERPIFDRTAEWLSAYREQSFFLVLDEAHLYRGAQGTEVALLIRRLIERLGIRESQLRVAITSASFSSESQALNFASQLVGRASSNFVPVPGKLHIASEGAPGDKALAQCLANIDLRVFHEAPSPEERLGTLKGLLLLLNGEAPERTTDSESLARLLFEALAAAPVRQRLVSITQKEALQVPTLAAELFPGVEANIAQRATEALIALSAFAKPSPDAANLLPSRIHTFHRGLPGLWACINTSCPGASPGTERYIGKLYAQPRERCDECGARVFEFFTCRSCGAPYVRASCASDQLSRPEFLWSRVINISSGTLPVIPLDVLLDPSRADPELCNLIKVDPQTGLVFSAGLREAKNLRDVGLYSINLERNEPIPQEGRLFYRCGICGDDNDPITKKKSKIRRKSPVEDHQTSGQEPFYTLVTEQLLRQPARAKAPAFLKKETPLAGRKVLIFSDGRQKAARLAAELGRSAMRDCLRPILLHGFSVRSFTLKHAYAALLVGAASWGVELRATDEKLDEQLSRDLLIAREAINEDYEQETLDELIALKPPSVIATQLLRVIRDKHTGVQALALARVQPSTKKFKLKELASPIISEDLLSKVVTLWLGQFLERYGSDIFEEELLDQGMLRLAASESSGGFKGLKDALSVVGENVANTFEKILLPELKKIFRSSEDNEDDSKITLNSSRITLKPINEEIFSQWGRCSRCSRVQPAVLPGACCVNCSARGTVTLMSPGSTAREQFEKRKGLYRRATLNTDELSRPRPLVAREHSAALTGVAREVHSRAERHELAFQDITAATIDGMRSPIDVLSCTTTMEVGIDIGDLSAVALRNMPPGRANYQQRAGRAGRRGSTVATVLAYADQDGHNQHSFENPARLIKAPVPDPLLNLSNPRIAERHVNAFILQCFALHAISPSAKPSKSDANLFASLGTITDFVSGVGPLTMSSLEKWLTTPAIEAELRRRIDGWLPKVVRGREALLAEFVPCFLSSIKRALPSTTSTTTTTDEIPLQEDLDAEDPGALSVSLLDRLLYEGILPKYAFPTDLASFYVFEATNGLGTKPSEARDRQRYAPQRELSIALSEYAPGRTIFIDGREWVSTALFSPLKGAVQGAFNGLQYFCSCSVCHYAVLSNTQTPPSGPCPSCGDEEFSKKSPDKWVRPPGFAHAVTLKPRTETSTTQFSRPGRATLRAPSPALSEWTIVPGSAGISSYLGYADHWDVIITNQGPEEKGFRACRSCGAIEPATEDRLLKPEHYEPFPSPYGIAAKCTSPNLEVVHLGTQFKTDVLLFRFQLPANQQLVPSSGALFQSTLSSLSNALSRAAAIVLEVEQGEVIAGSRPAFTKDAVIQSAVEIFLYDRLVGGAGYVVELSSPENIKRLLSTAKALLSHEPIEGAQRTTPCDRACYSCLMSFQNSYEHALLDRHLALDLIVASETGVAARLSVERAARAYEDIANCLMLWGKEVLRNEPVVPEPDAPRADIAAKARDGQLIIPALCHPFSALIPDDNNLRLLHESPGLPIEVVPLKYIEVTQALPAALENLRRRLDV